MELYLSLVLEVVQSKIKVLSGCPMRAMLLFQNGMKENDDLAPSVGYSFSLLVPNLSYAVGAQWSADEMLSSL